MNIDDNRTFVLICGRDSRERKRFLESLYYELRRNRRVRRLDNAADSSPGAPMNPFEIDFLGELMIRDFSISAVPQARDTAAETPVIVASLPYAAAADLPAPADAKSVRIIDLNRYSLKEAKREALRAVSRLDAEKIGAFAGIGGLVEVGLGSTLHAYKIPLKGHFLSSLQNLLLISFGKALNGRGLVRISFISAMLKAFSPMGGTLRPMLFIFLQGTMFALPTLLLGWHAVSVLAGSVLMGSVTLGISLSMDYLIFGQSIFEAAQSGVGHLLGSLGLESPSLSELLIFAFLLRAAASVVIWCVAYFGDVLPAVSHVADIAFRKRNARAASVSPTSSNRKRSSSATAALFGILRPGFLAAFLLSMLLIRFFTDLSSAELTTTAIRGLCISYLGFLLMHRIDVRALGARLDKRFDLDLEKSLPIAAKRLGRSPRRG